MYLNNKCALKKFISLIDTYDIIVKYYIYIYIYIYQFLQQNNFKMFIFTSYIILQKIFNIFMRFDQFLSHQYFVSKY